jgi:hypothetical protein
MPVTDQRRTVVAIFGNGDRAENAIAELLKLGISRERISPEARKARPTKSATFWIATTYPISAR